MAGLLSCWQNRPIWTSSADIHVPVPADSLWDLVIDLDSLPLVIPSVVNFERAKVEGLRDDDQGKCQLGTRFHETRMIRGRRSIILTKIVTSLDDSNPDRRHLSFGISFSNSMQGKTYNVENTSTLTVLPINEDSSSQLILTISAASGGLNGLCSDVFCRPCKQRMINDSMEEEINGYRREAIRRQEKAAKRVN
mmetsp:Transcript_18283/g.27070  ORF Transcript_18283/g.27070 Transcript_18283/m.27070 type:complete len:194 (+) Transcript_18283:176-757(+)